MAARVARWGLGQPWGASGRVLTEADLLRLKLWYAIGAVLSADRRQRLFDAIAAEPAAATVKADEFLIVDVGAARRQLAGGVRQLEQAEALVHSDPGVMGGEPVFKRTRIPVRTVAAMLAEGATVDEIAQGYPSLTPRMIELATIWSAAHPARGRPRRPPDPFSPTSSTRVVLKGDPRRSSPGHAA